MAPLFVGLVERTLKGCNTKQADMAYLRRIQLVRFQTSLLLMEKP